MRGHDRAIGADDGSGTYFEPACTAPDPEQRVASAEESFVVRARVGEALGRLNARERMIVEERFMVEMPTQLGYLGQRFGVSRERARQLQEAARQKLRASLDAA